MHYAKLATNIRARMLSDAINAAKQDGDLDAENSLE